MRVRERIQTTRQADKSEIGWRRRNKSGWMRRVQPDQDGVLATLGQFSQGYVGRRNESTSRTPPRTWKKEKDSFRKLLRSKKFSHTGTSSCRATESFRQATKTFENEVFGVFFLIFRSSFFFIVLSWRWSHCWLSTKTRRIEFVVF